MKSELLTPEIATLRQRQSELVTQLAEVKKDHDKKEKVAQQASRISMNAYYKMKEIESAIEKIEASIETLNSVEKDQW